MGRIFDALNHVSAPLPVSEKPIGFDEPPTVRDEPAEIPFIEVPEETSPRSRGAVIPVCRPAGETVTAPPAKGVRFLAAAPHASASETGAESPLSIWTREDDPQATQYRAVRVAIRDRLARDRPHTLLLLPVEAKLSCEAALHLALAFAEEPGRTTLLIDAGSPRSRLLASLGAAQAPGWSELLAGAPLPQVLQDSGWPGLHIVAPGNRLVHAYAATSGERVRSLLLQLKTHYDVILLKTLAWSEAHAALTLAHAADATCLLSSQPTHEKKDEHACLTALHREGVRVLGSVVLA